MPNRLASATSPYLLQHQDNPVDWREWGEEAFAEAVRRDVPVLLSIGYAASVGDSRVAMSSRTAMGSRASASSRARQASAR